MDREPSPGYLGDALSDVPTSASCRSTAIPELIRVVVNSEQRELPAGSDLAELLRALDIPPHHIAIELNGALHEGALDVVLSQGDRVEIVRFVGGG